jgi:chemotaxis protein CheD
MNAGTESQTIYLKPGELLVTSKPVVIKTLLGSCISVVLFHKPSGMSGITHSMMPYNKNNSSDIEKYTDSSINALYKSFEQNNIPKEEIAVMLFGGADMFEVSVSSKSQTIGQMNIESAKSTLDKIGLIIKKESIGGNQGRHIYLYSSTGQVFLKQINSLDS